MESFFSDKGVILLATLAHSTNTFMHANHKVEENSIWVDIYYEDYRTELKIIREGDYFTKIEVIFDDYWNGPFTAIGIVKNLVWDDINENYDHQIIDEFMRKTNATISEMNGNDLACLILTLSWFDYNK